MTSRTAAVPVFATHPHRAALRAAVVVAFSLALPLAFLAQVASI